MNKPRFFIVIWSVIILILLGYIYKLMAGSDSSLFSVSLGFNADTVVLKQQSTPTDNIKTLDISTTFESIELLATDKSQFCITQYGGKNIKAENLFNIVENNGALTVSTGNEVNILIGVNFARNRLVVEIPRSWIGSVDLMAQSGSVKVMDEFKFEDFNIKTTSGSIKLQDKIVCDGNFSVSASSGGIRFSEQVDCGGNLDVSANSGSIRFEGKINCSRNLDISTSSGGIKLQDQSSAKQLRIKANSGSIQVFEANTDSFDIKSSSGGVKLDSIAGKGNIESSSGSIRGEMTAVSGNVFVKSNSGGVSITLPEDLSFDFEADTSSGSIKSDFDVLYTSKRKNNAVASVGAKPSVKITVQTTSGSIRVSR